jgi:hypothetical protein
VPLNILAVTVQQVSQAPADEAVVVGAAQALLALAELALDQRAERVITGVWQAAQPPHPA